VSTAPAWIKRGVLIFKAISLFTNLFVNLESYIIGQMDIPRDTQSRQISRHAYPTDISDKGWEIASPLLIKDKANLLRGGRPRFGEIREILNAILYILASGIPWRMLPHDMPKWQTVRSYYDSWKKDGLLEEIVLQMRQNKIRVAINKKVKYEIFRTRSLSDPYETPRFD
jgi:transposase